MNRRFIFCVILFVFMLSARHVLGQEGTGPVGIFEGHQDVGTVLHPGSTSYDAAKQSYTVTGSGDNMWFGIDDFQFAWKKMSGDVAISADIAFVGEKGNNHRKAVLMIRQSLDRQFSSGRYCATRRWVDFAAVSRCGGRR